ncbi:glutathione S-transferase [Jeongeupia naejangsanensis]|uniref:Glutathione S-transferase n=1 Tax=Jeongeupia naejangsanensis TaxID=613195 RepID=A0ABS2BPX6_9NEIS|nr:glutathione S-transferase [Jeongeupia naejangsanensis]MBM3117485.1 glutathione S-transferase [Jeongeupia naejangsanensis]
MKPLLYTFRRCPYAMRARLAIAASGVDVEQHEVVLRDKPAGLLAASPKGTVPVLCLPDGRVIEQSLDIMLWALATRDPQRWLADRAGALALIADNDDGFKRDLDHYKYAERFPEHPASHYRQRGERFLARLEAMLAQQAHLGGMQPGLADAALFPFVRQFAHVDKAWFYAAPYPRLIAWLDDWLASPLFATVMQKT